MGRLRVHRTASLVFVVLLGFAALGALAAAETVEQSEARLLRDRTAQVQSLLESLGSGMEAQLASVAAIAAVTEADPFEFRTAVAAVDADGDDGTGDWAILRRTDAGFVAVEQVGAPTSPASFPAGWEEGLEAASAGEFRVLGFTGDGLTRRLGLATGSPGGGDLVVFTEISLMGAAGSASTEGGGDLLSDIAIDVFIGSEPDPSQRLLALGTPDPDTAREQVVDVAGVELLLVVAPTQPLVGIVATRLPWLLFAGGLLVGLSIAALVEVSQRRRDDALSTVRDLEQKNEQLDRALADQRAAEAARAALEDELRRSQRLEALGHLAGGVAHDFNNVLAAILSYADLAADGVTDPATRADLTSIQDAARRGAGLTRQLLQFSRREPGDAVVVDLNARVLDVVGMLGRTLGDSKSLRCDLTPAGVEVLADPVELDQILLNLIVNARDAVAPGGTITVTTSRADLDDAARAVMPDLEAGPHVVLSVLDDGVGMEPEVVEHAFEPFYTTKGRAQGTGLGLSTVYGIVQRLGGHVSVSSEPGVGTTFSVVLPAVEASAPVIAATAGGDR